MSENKWPSASRPLQSSVSSPSSASRREPGVDEIDTAILPVHRTALPVDQVSTAKVPQPPSMPTEARPYTQPQRFMQPATLSPVSPQSVIRDSAVRHSVKSRLLNLFVVESSSGDSMGFIDGLRAIACLAVVTVHARTAGSTFIVPLPGMGGTGLDFGPVIASGFVGVELFFVLSGFLLAQTWIRADLQGKPRPSWRRYVRLRIARIVPAYYVCLLFLLIFFVPAVIKPSIAYSKFGLFTIAAHLVFAQFFFPVASASFGVAGQFWTLSIEAVWYVVLPLVIAAFFRRRWVLALPVAAAISLGWQAAVSRWLAPTLLPSILTFSHHVGASSWYTAGDAYMYISSQFPAHVIDFALGITLANLYLHSLQPNRSQLLVRLTSPGAGIVYLILGLVLVVVPMYAINPAMPLLHSTAHVTPWLSASAAHTVAVYFEDFISLGFTLVLAGALFGSSWIRSALSIMPLRILGILSYSIYLFHLPILHNVEPLLSSVHGSPDIKFALYFGCMLAETLVVATLVYLFVEKPFIIRARYSGRAKRAMMAQA